MGCKEEGRAQEGDGMCTGEEGPWRVREERGGDTAW